MSDLARLIQDYPNAMMLIFFVLLAFLIYREIRHGQERAALHKLLAPVQPPAQTFDFSDLAVLALGLSQQEKIKGAAFPDQGRRFSAQVEALASAPEFEAVKAEAAAEFLKAKAADVDQVWTRFGLRSGTYLALLPLIIVYMLATETLQLASVSLALILGVSAFITGIIADTIQLHLKSAEALLKAAVKRNAQLVATQTLQQLPLTIIPTAVVQRIEGQHRSMMNWSIGGIVAFALVAMIVLAFYKS